MTPQHNRSATVDDVAAFRKEDEFLRNLVIDIIRDNPDETPAKVLERVEAELTHYFAPKLSKLTADQHGHLREKQHSEQIGHDLNDGLKHIPRYSGETHAIPTGFGKLYFIGLLLFGGFCIVADAANLARFLCLQLDSMLLAVLSSTVVSSLPVTEAAFMGSSYVTEKTRKIVVMVQATVGLALFMAWLHAVLQLGGPSMAGLFSHNHSGSGTLASRRMFFQVTAALAISGVCFSVALSKLKLTPASNPTYNTWIGDITEALTKAGSHEDKALELNGLIGAISAKQKAILMFAESKLSGVVNAKLGAVRQTAALIGQPNSHHQRL